MRTLLLLVLGPILGSFLSCDDAVTDPLRRGFDADPQPLLGEWGLQGDDGRPSSEHMAFIERGEGVLFGRFTFPLFGQEWTVNFADVATWDGETFVFTHPETYGLDMPLMTWTARFIPEGRFVNIPAHLEFQGIRTFRYLRDGTRWPVCEEPPPLGCILGSGDTPGRSARER